MKSENYIKILNEYLQLSAKYLDRVNLHFTKIIIQNMHLNHCWLSSEKYYSSAITFNKIW